MLPADMVRILFLVYRITVQVKQIGIGIQAADPVFVGLVPDQRISKHSSFQSQSHRFLFRHRDQLDCNLTGICFDRADWFHCVDLMDAHQIGVRTDLLDRYGTLYPLQCWNGDQ